MPLKSFDVRATDRADTPGGGTTGCNCTAFLSSGTACTVIIHVGDALQFALAAPPDRHFFRHFCNRPPLRGPVRSLTPQGERTGIVVGNRWQSEAAFFRAAKRYVANRYARRSMLTVIGRIIGSPFCLALVSTRSPPLLFALIACRYLNHT